MSSEQDFQAFMTRKDAAHLLGVTGRTITRWVNNGNLKAWKTEGGQNRISKQSVETLLQKRQHELDSPQQPEKLTILVVEDDPVFMALYLGAIKAWQELLCVQSATDGFDAMLQIGQLKPDLILTDLKMPGMDGFQMIRTLKSKPEFASIEIMAITVLNAEEIGERGGLPDDIHVLYKPVSISQLKQLILSILKKTGIR